MIVALGDSTTAGTPRFLSPVEAPPDGKGDIKSQYAYWLMQWHKDWTVLNRGVNGERSDQIAARFDRDVLAHKPAVVVIIAGVNDVYDGDPVGAITPRLAHMYERARAAGLPVVACSILPYDTATPDQNARMHAINAWIRQTALRAPGMAFCDTRTAAASPLDGDRLLESPDRLHPGVAGYRRMAVALVPVVRRLLTVTGSCA